MSKKNAKIVPVTQIEECIFEIRAQRVMIDSDLAKLYGVTTGNFNKAVSRNAKRFPKDFRFQLSSREFTDLKFQFGTSSSWGGRRTLPYAFTEYGAIMAANILQSEAAVRMSVHVVRAFVEAQSVDTNRKFEIVFQALEELMVPPASGKKRKIGFGR